MCAADELRPAEVDSSEGERRTPSATLRKMRRHFFVDGFWVRPVHVMDCNRPPTVGRTAAVAEASQFTRRCMGHRAMIQMTEKYLLKSKKNDAKVNRSTAKRYAPINRAACRIFFHALYDTIVQFCGLGTRIVATTIIVGKNTAISWNY